jgi:hypothetical protein
MPKSIIEKTTRLATLAGVICFISPAAYSQTAGARGTKVSPAKTPYTAEYKIAHIQTLSDGTTITKESTEIKVLDSQGRRMTATTVTSGEQMPVTHVMVFDPVAHTQIFWHSPGKIAHLLQMSPAAAELHCMTIARDDFLVVSGPKAQYRSEDLGTDSIQGIEVRGHRQTTTIPVAAMGNDAPLVSTAERWTALAVGLNNLLVRAVTDDPRRGRSIQELTNFSESEPDPATFQPPKDFQIVTKNASGCQPMPPAEATSRSTGSR